MLYKYVQWPQSSCIVESWVNVAYYPTLIIRVITAYETTSFM